MTRFTKLIFVFAFSLMLNACYHPDIQQGNILNQTEVSQLKLGMSKAEVINLLGTPVMQDIFNEDRLVYIYTNLPNHGDFTKKKMLLYFQNNQLTRIVGASEFN